MRTRNRDREADAGHDPGDGRRPRHLLDLGVVFLLGAVLRVGSVLHSPGGPRGVFGYDAGVYYASSDALLHGRMPYADFLLLHPPAISLFLTPFAALGLVAGDHAGFVAANTAVELLGALNAVLVVLIARRAGLTRRAALGGGIFSALWVGSVESEMAIRLEPVGNTALLVGLLLLLRAQQRAAPRRWPLLAGAAFGVAVSTKIWWAVPVLVVLGWLLAHRGERRTGLLTLTGTVLGAALIAGPFFARAPSAMWRMVISDQFGRPPRDDSVVRRLQQLTSLDVAARGVTGAELRAVLAIGGLLTLLLVVCAWRAARLRVVVVMAAAQLVLLLEAPIFIPYYADYLAPGAALTLAAGLSVAATGSRWRRGTQLSAAVGTAGLVAVALVSFGTLAAHYPNPYAPTRFPGRYLAAHTAGLRCVLSDSPTALIELDVLSRGLVDGCANWVDVTGRTYDVDRPRAGRHRSRVHDRRWQSDLGRYLLSGDAVITIRPDTGIGPALATRLRRLPVVTSRAGYRLSRVPPTLRTNAPH